VWKPGRLGAPLGTIALVAMLPCAAGGASAHGTIAVGPTLTTRQAHGISVVVQFLDAFNAGNFKTTNTLRAIGFPHGIRPQLATKIVFTSPGAVRITQFGAAGNDAACRPTP
jgi:hypothetical protein